MSGTEKREGKRIAVTGLEAFISSANSIAPATIINISHAGLCAGNVDRSKMRPSPQYHLSITAHGLSSIFPVKPRWARPTNHGATLDIGFKILYLPCSWWLLFERFSWSNHALATHVLRNRALRTWNHNH